MLRTGPLLTSMWRFSDCSLNPGKSNTRRSGLERLVPSGTNGALRVISIARPAVRGVMLILSITGTLCAWVAEMGRSQRHIHASSLVELRNSMHSYRTSSIIVMRCSGRAMPRFDLVCCGRCVFLPLGAESFPDVCTHDLRRGLHSCAASRLLNSATQSFTFLLTFRPNCDA